MERRGLAGEDIVRLILDGTVVKARIDRKATAISVLVAIGVRRDGQKILLAIRNMGGESKAAWCSVAGEAKAAWCSVGGPRLDTDTRPSLARIA